MFAIQVRCVSCEIRTEFSNIIYINFSLLKFCIIFELSLCYSILNNFQHRKLHSTGLFEMIVGVLTTCHTQYTWDSSVCIFLINRTTLQVFVTYLTGALYVHPLWFYKHQHDNRMKWIKKCKHTKRLLTAAILVNCAPSGEMHNYCKPHIIKENSENFLVHRCNYILPSQVYCVWQVVKTPTNISNNPVFHYEMFRISQRSKTSMSRNKGSSAHSVYKRAFDIIKEP
jgi:hypothetical protein